MKLRILRKRFHHDDGYDIEDKLQYAEQVDMGDGKFVTEWRDIPIVEEQ